MKTKKAQLVQLLDGRIIIIPLEEFKNGLFDWENRDKICKFIEINPPEVKLMVYRKNDGYNLIGNEQHTATPPTGEDIQRILNKDKGLCFIEVDNDNELSTPSNMLGNLLIVIHPVNNEKKV